MALAPTTVDRRRRRAPGRPAPEPAAELEPIPSTAPLNLPAYMQPTGNAVIASAATVPLENLGWDKPQSSRQWQRELWRLLDIVGELRYAAGWVASNVSRVVLRMHDVDDDGEIGGETKNPEARKIAASLLGRPAERREVLRMAGFQLWLVGETYLGALAAGGDRKRDEWFAVSAGDIKREGVGKVAVDLGRGKQVLRAGQDLLLRCWTPHPDKAADADSTARSCRIILRELEKLTLFVFAQIDSRLASGGVFVVPAGMSTGDGDITAQDLMRQFVKNAAESLKGEGTAGGVVPLVLEVPADALGKLQHLLFSAELSAQAPKLRDEARQRLAQALDIPVEELQGMGDSNHWSSYQIGPDGVKKHIEPLMARLCLALQRGWVEAALEAKGLDPDKFHIWYDTTPLIVRPQRFQEALELWREGRLSARALLDAAGFYDADAPEADEDVQRYLRELVLRDPQLFNQASVRKLLGITDEMLPPSSVAAVDTAPGAAGQPEQQILTDSKTPPPPPPAPETLPKKPVTGRPPVSRDRQPKGVAASAAVLDEETDALIMLADVVSLRALELAGGRLLDHKTRGQFKSVPKHELHTHIPVSLDTHDPDKLLAGSVDLLGPIAEFCGISEGMAGKLATALHDNCVKTLLSGRPYSRERTVIALQVAGLLDAPD